MVVSCSCFFFASLLLWNAQNYHVAGLVPPIWHWGENFGTLGAPWEQQEGHLQVPNRMRGPHFESLFGTEGQNPIVFLGLFLNHFVAGL